MEDVQSWAVQRKNLLDMHEWAPLMIETTLDAAYLAGLEHGQLDKTDLIAKLEKMKFIEAAFSPDRLVHKQIHNRTLDQVIELLKV